MSMNRKTLVASCCLIAAALPVADSRAQSSLPADIPIPLAHPFAPAGARPSPVDLVVPRDPLVTSSVGRPANPGRIGPDAVGGVLKEGLDALYSRNVAGAIMLRDGMPHGTLDRQILTWAIATSGIDGVPSGEITAAITELSGWPGKALLRRNAERALYKENPPAAAVLDAFGNRRPLTAEGMILLARAYVATGNKQKAHALLSPWWQTARIDTEDEKKVLGEFSGVLTLADNQMHFLRAIYNGQLESAKLVAGPAGAQSFYAAYEAMMRQPEDAARKIEAVDRGWQRNPAYLFLKIRYLRREKHLDEAAALMLKAPRQAAMLVDPDAWWVERRILSRQLLDANEPQLAYDIVAAHAAESPSAAAEAEFHAGWYALRALNRPKLAAAHFARIAEISARPISASRAYYWLGRAAEAGAGGDARAWYRRSAHFGTTFYGQLSAARLNEKAPELLYPKPTEADRIRFAARPSVLAIRRLEEIGYGDKAAPIYIQLAQEIDSVGELALLAVLAEHNDKHYLALRVGKIAAMRGLDVGALSHPLGAIPASANISGSGKALAYAIARQESEFNVSAISKAGARGLLQLMPATAKIIAARNGMRFSLIKLTTDPGYNATLGAHFLGEQLDRFNGSYILTFAGYNAGPKRAEEWIAKYGDPRGKPIDQVVDWIERIPYSETRNYVQRVMENYEIYKARLTGSADIETDLVYGRR